MKKMSLILGLKDDEGRWQLQEMELPDSNLSVQSMGKLQLYRGLTLPNLKDFYRAEKETFLTA